ncbi:mitotic checkpoint regulator, MAD2B-interacting-domain-containing protein [Dactylonectria macrodidyma]|uniref:Mitotic checkpoint regulator, MAD2B-interacting-domain-containing protein n=1 Tax=Dactylonectria macrodidyma TaxID=307937 RepID=A0A9P9J4V4_9HYPO|nr:mitotic checkpoint regulator, MAD2B-interacting-domain-containing protein [Dactylonectria macrodidyma]
MGLVDYSDSEGSGSDTEAPAKIVPKVAPKPTQLSSKKPFQKVVDRSNPGRILVNLPQLSAEAPKAQGDEPPAKRARTGAAGRFSGFNSFLPPPKNANKPKPAPVTSSAGPAIHFKTSAAPGFRRNAGDEHESESSTRMSLPPPKASTQPSIPEGQKPEEEVKLVGKPLMFKPLSVARTQKKKKPTSAAVAKAATQNTFPQAPAATEVKVEAEPAPAPKKVSLFSMHTEEPSEPSDITQKSGAYTPMFETQETTAPYDSSAYGDYAQYASQAQTGPSATTAPGSESLDTIVNDMGLSAAARRELFGRGGEGKHMAKNVINFNMDKEYEHNEEIRAAGDQQTHNPVRAIQGGKHSLRQLVQNVHSQKEALEDSFAKGRTNRKEASNKYGW